MNNGANFKFQPLIIHFSNTISLVSHVEVPKKDKEKIKTEFLTIITQISDKK